MKKFSVEEYGAEKKQSRPLIQRVMGIPFNFTFTGAANYIDIKKVTISTGFNFLWEITSLFKYGIAGVTTPVDFQLNIRDEFTTEDMFISPLWASSITGDGKQQNILPRPYVFLGGTTITLTATDVIGTTGTWYAQIALIGYKIKEVRR